MCAAAPRACGYSAAFEGLQTFRIAVAILDPEHCLRLEPGDFENPIRAFFAREGEGLREMVCDDSEDFIAIILEARPATSLDVRIGTYGTLRVQLMRRALVRRTNEPADAAVWEDEVAYFLRLRDPALDSLLAETRVLLQRFRNALMQPPPVADLTEADILAGPRPCPPFRPGHIRFSVPIHDPEDALPFSSLEFESVLSRTIQNAMPELHARLSPLGDNELDLRVDCTTIRQDEVTYGICGAVRSVFREPVLLDDGKTCVQGVTWMEKRGFFVDDGGQAGLAVQAYMPELLGEFASRRARLLPALDPRESAPDAAIQPPDAVP